MKKLATKIGMCLLAAGTINISSQLQAQNVGISATGVMPNNSAGLDVDFTNKGLLIPRVALTSATDGATIPSPATSLLVYNTGTGGLSPAGYYYNAGTSSSPNWVKLLNTGSPTEAWLTTGNAGTTAGTHFLGTTDNVDLVFKTNNIERMRILNAGRVGINTSTPGSYYLDVLSNNSSIDGIRGYHTSGTTTSAFAAVTGSVSNTSYTTATGYLGYHNSNNKTFAVYGNGGDLAGMFSGKVGINSLSTGITGYDLEVRNNTSANPASVILRQSTSNTAINSILGNLDFGDNYNTNAQAKIQVIRDAAASSISDLPTAIVFWTTNDGTSTPTEKMRITNNGNVGIGTTTPGYKLSVYDPGETNYIYVGAQQLPNGNQGNIGYMLEGTQTGWAIYQGDPDGGWGVGPRNFEIWEYPKNPGTTPECCRRRLVIESTYSLYTGGGPINLVLQNNGDVCTYGNFVTCSDERLKTNFFPLDSVLKKLLSIKPYNFKWDINKYPNRFNDTTIQIGFKASEMKRIFPEVVSVDSEGFMQIKYDKLTVILWKSIQEQQQIINHLKDENEYLKQELQKQNQKFSAELEKIKQHIGIGEAKK